MALRRLAVDARHGEGRLAANGDAIGQAESLQPGAELGVAPVVRIDDHRRDREARLPNRPHLRQRDAPLLAKAHRRRQSSRGATRGVVGPRDREIQVVREWPRASVGDQRARDCHLAIADLAERAAILALDADGLRALLGKAGVIDREDARADRHDRAQLGPHALGIPGRVRDEVLQRLILTRSAQPPMHGLHRLPLAVIEQPVEILTGGLALRLAAEAGTEPIQELPQASQQFPGGSRRHARSVGMPRESTREIAANAPDHCA